MLVLQMPRQPTQIEATNSRNLSQELGPAKRGNLLQKGYRGPPRASMMRRGRRMEAAAASTARSTTSGIFCRAVSSSSLPRSHRISLLWSPTSQVKDASVPCVHAADDVSSTHPHFHPASRRCPRPQR